MRYSNDLREKALNLIIDQNKSQKYVYLLLNIGEATIYRWLARYRKTNTMKYINNIKSESTNKINDVKKFKEFIDNNKDKSLKTLTSIWNSDISNNIVSYMTISRAISNKLHYSFKKSLGYIEKETKD